MSRRQDVAVSKHIVKRLGEHGVEETMSRLFPVDCQTCNGPLAGATVALVVTDMMIFATAELHHRACRKSEWNDSGMINSVSTPTLSHRMLSTLVPWTNTTTSETVTQPMFLLNPGLEQVFLDRGDDGDWHVQLPARFRDLDLVAGDLVSDRPVREAVVRLPQGGVALTVENIPTETFVCGADEEYRSRVRARGGVMLVVTHAVDPHRVGRGDELLAALEAGPTASGWVELAEVRDRRPRKAPASNPAVVGTTYVLHRSPRNLTVGPLLAHTPQPMTVEQAQQWAQQRIGCDTLIGWQPTIAGEPASGWFNIDAISVAHYLLRQYPDGWRLVRSLSRVDGKSSAETDNEARVWANNVLKFKDQVTGLRWEPGPTPDGAVTLYATVGQ